MTISVTYTAEEEAAAQLALDQMAVSGLPGPFPTLAAYLDTKAHDGVAGLVTTYRNTKKADVITALQTASDIQLDTVASSLSLSRAIIDAAAKV